MRLFLIMLTSTYLTNKMEKSYIIEQSTLSLESDLKSQLQFSPSIVDFCP